MRGIDISRHDSLYGGYPLKSVPQRAFNDSDFVIVKATQGTSYKYVSYFKKQIQAVLNAGKLAGAYHYSAGGDPKKEAEYFLQTVKPYLGRIILCLDWESMQNKSWGSKTWCKQFIDYVKDKTGITCFLYTGLDGCNHNKSLAGKVPLWFAGYPDNLNTWRVPRFKYNLGAWNYTIWQYTSSGEKCDRNTTEMTKDQWIACAKGENMTDRQKVVNTLEMLYGIREGSPEHKLIINTFNKSKLCPRYQMTTKDAWCATTVSFAFIAAGLAGKEGSGALFQCVECSCPKMIEKAKKQGIWVENDNYTPKAGDVIMYDWQDSGIGDNKGTSDHTGIVMKVADGYIYVIEGNKNDAIGVRQIKIGGKGIRGFICPKYEEKKAVPKQTKKAYTGVLPKLPPRGYYKLGDGMTVLKDRRADIQRLQKAVNWAIGSALIIDGEYGEKTRKAVLKLQKAHKLTPNGCYGNKCQSVIKALRK